MSPFTGSPSTYNRTAGVLLTKIIGGSFCTVTEAGAACDFSTVATRRSSDMTTV
jgi:hypothetical protein